MLLSLTYLWVVLLALVANVEAFVSLRRCDGVLSKPSTFTKTTTTLRMGLLNRFRKKKELKTVEPIRTGQTLPEVDVEVVVSASATQTTDELDSSRTSTTTTTATIQEIVGGPGTNLLIGMPGAYTPVCSESHMPGYLKAVDKLQKLGVNTIAVVTTNDKFVNGAWAKDLGILTPDIEQTKASSGPITILADGDGDLVQQLGLAEDMGYGIGVRSKRFVMILQDGVVQQVEVDEGMETCDKTRADEIVRILTPVGTSTESSDINMGAAAGIGLAIAAAVAATMAGVGDGDTASTSSSALPDGFSLLQQFGSQ